MATQAAHDMNHKFHRVSGMLTTVFGQVRLSIIYAVVGIIIAVAWLASVLAQGGLVQNTYPNKTSSTPPTTLQPPTDNQSTESTTMDQTSPDVTNTIQTQVQSNDMGTSVNVNGSEQTLAPGQTFQQSYTSPDGSSQTDITVSGGSSSSTSGQSANSSVHVHTHSTAQSESDEP